ncbi:MAG: sulfotransferase [Rhodospirillales bacterium]|nr:sulfotransferase [Rhodospirillales bacterium]
MTGERGSGLSFCVVKHWRSLHDRPDNHNMIADTTAVAPSVEARNPKCEPISDWRDRMHALLRKPIFFVVGCQKSGTTWVQKLLNGHPAVCCHGEGYFGPVLIPVLQQAIQLYNQKHKAGDIGNFGMQELQQTAAATMAIAMNRWFADTPIEQIAAVGEKTPEHALCLPALQQCFPGAKVIHIMRDGRDVCTSGWFHNQRLGKPSFAQQFPTLDRYVQYTATQHWLPYIQKARAFGQERPELYHELRYEDLHADAGGVIRAMLEFLQVDASEDAVAACARGGSFEKLSGGRERGSEDNQSFFRKGVVGDWRNHFDDAATAVFQKHAGPMLDELGYER